MVVIETKTRKWGNSLGVIIPRGAVEASNLKEEQNIKLIILKDSGNVLRETFGILRGKLKKSAQQMKDEFRRELYDI
jgi:antitoxin component of MazEF toxin-antitoxin module